MEATAIGIDLGGTNLRAAWVNQNGKILASDRCKTPVEEGPAATVFAMKELVEKLIPSDNHLPIGIGIGSPGPLSRKGRKIFQTPNLPGFDSYPLGEKLEELTKIPVKIDNDAKCATYGEARFGVAKGCDNFILMTFGTGIGGGIFSNGKMIYGKSDGACEIGHMTLYPGGKQCKCGNKGCLEQYISATAFKARASAIAGREVGGREVFDSFEEGQAWATEFMREFTVDVATGVASLVNIFDPEKVIFAGGLFSSGGGPLASWVSEAIKDRCFKSSQEGLEVAVSSLKGDAGVLGAASLCLF
ncbi:ROK family protein [bacterium]|nr:ROK family protein [bacterium]